MEHSLYERICKVQQTHWWYRSRQLFLDRVLKDLPRGGLVLDAGCGPGSMLEYLGGYGTVIGIDGYRPALEMARTVFSGSLVHGGLHSLPFADNTFALVAACEVLYHRNIDDVGAAVCELSRVLKPGGSLLIVDSAYASCSSGHDRVAHGVRRFTRDELAGVMAAAGIVVIRSTYAYALLLPLVWLIRRCKAVFALGDGSGGELAETWQPLNDLVLRWFSLEAAVAGRWGLPFGLSVQLLGQKPLRKDD